MSLSQDIDDKSENFGSKIMLANETFDEDSNPFKNNISDTQRVFLRVGRPGKLLLKPNYTAFTKTNLGSIPSRIEKTLIKTDENIPITVTINKSIQKSYNTPKKDIQLYKDPRSYSTSYSSKGYGVGFVSQVPRFSSEKRQAIYPGPGQYSLDKLISVENEVNKSLLGQSLFFDQTAKSLHLLNNKAPQYFTSQEILNKIKKKYNERYLNNLTYDSFSNNNSNNNSKNLDDNKDNKGNYFFESKVEKFNKGLFDCNNKNPGPGRYFIDTNFKIKNQNQKSPDFMEPTRKRISPEKIFGLLKNDEKKIGFGLVDNKKNGKVASSWKGIPSLGKSYDFGNTIKNKKKIKKIEDSNGNDDNIVNIPDIDTSKKLKNLGILRYKMKDNSNEKEKKKIYEYKFDNFKKENNDLIMKELSKFKRKDFFGLAPPRWDEGMFHDNASHFQIPGPAYYDPKIQSNKRSFNFNYKDFIFTNSVPFKEMKKSDLYSNSIK